MNQQKVTLEFTIGELRNLQIALQILKSIKASLALPDKNSLLPIEEKINVCLGDPLYIQKRLSIDDGIRECFANDPEEMAVALKKFEKDYPPPPAIRHYRGAR
jgi:hypothetical protein